MRADCLRNVQEPSTAYEAGTRPFAEKRLITFFHEGT